MQKHGEIDYKKHYCKMFPIDEAAFEKEALDALAIASLNQLERAAATDIPAGYSYIGQFIAHDMTRLNIATEIPTDEGIDIGDLIQEVSPSLDLDGLYGGTVGFGENIRKTTDGLKFYSDKIRPDTTGKSFVIYDLPRDDKDLSKNEFIGDSRNDENYFLAQIHVLFMNLHNRLVDLYEEASDPDPFSSARKETTLLYQQMIRNDFLERILDPRVYENHFDPKLRIDPDKTILSEMKKCDGTIPLEFAGAVFRFGHSIIRSNYRIRFLDKHKKRTKVLNLTDLFELTGPGGRSKNVGTSEYQLDWRFLFDFGRFEGLDGPERTKSIDTYLVPELRELRNVKPGNENLLKRNLYRGAQLKLPCGQDIVEYIKANHSDYFDAMDIDAYNVNLKNLAMAINPIPILETEFFLPDPADLTFFQVLEKWGLWNKTPLWTYILLEPWFNKPKRLRNARLGKLGSVIVAEVFRSLLDSSRTSVTKSFDFDNPKLKILRFLGKPSVGAGTASRNVTPANRLKLLKMTDLVEFVYPDLKTPLGEQNG